MGFFILKSTNPKLGFVIAKNQASGMIMRSIRSGVSHGWYFNDQTYIVRFIDINEGISFKKHKHDNFDYLPSLQ